MRRYGTLLLTLLLAVAALGCGVLAAYSLSILRWGEWKYPELYAPISGAAILGLLALFGMGLINRRERGTGAVIRFTVLATAVCCVTTVGLSLALLSNCTLSCGNKVLAQNQSPSGRYKAVSFARNCVAATGYCPSVSSVSVLGATETLPAGEGNVFTLMAGDGVELEWKSDTVLLVRYSAGRFLRRQERVGHILIEYQSVGWM